MKRRKAIKNMGMSVAGLLAAPAFCSLLLGCQEDSSEKGIKRFIFNSKQDQMVAEISELIIPATESPGAKEAGVSRFIDLMLKDCYYENDQQRFLEGLDRMENECQKNYNRPFLKASTEQQKVLLKNEAQDGQEPPRPTRFFQLMKELTLLGYFTSEVGATKALAYNPNPGKFNGCIPLKKGDKAWAL